jgi:hypothetical protein
MSGQWPKYIKNDWNRSDFKPMLHAILGLQFLKMSREQRRFAKAYAKELRSDIAACETKAFNAKAQVGFQEAHL